MTAQRDLANLLLSLFSADELRRWLRYLPDGDKLAGKLPGANASPASLASEAVAELEREGMIGDDFWARMLEERPRRKGDIDKVRVLYPAGGDAVGAETRVLPSMVGSRRTNPGEQDPPNSICTVLLVSASPASAERLRVDSEFSNIITRMQAARHRERFKFVQVQAASLDALSTALQEHEPHVLHISVHGESDGALLFEGVPEYVPMASMLALLDALKDRLRLVVLTACHSEKLAAEIPSIIDVAIGMNEKVGDKIATNFAVKFYESLGFGKSVETAYKVAVASLGGIGNDAPRLYPPADADPGGKRKLTLLTPMA